MKHLGRPALRPSPQHERFLTQVGGSTGVRIAPPRAAGSTGLSHASPYLLVACPVVLEGRAIRIVEVWQRPEVSPEAARGYADVLSALCELAADFHRRARLQELQERESQWDRARQFCEHLQRPLDLQAVAFAVANEGRRVLGADRITVVVRRRGRLRVQAISGLDSFDPRATPVRLLERLAERVAATAEPLFYAVASPATAPQLEAAVEEYIDQTHVRTLAAIPLAEPAPDGDAPPAPHGVLVLESFTPKPAGDADRAMLELVCRQASLALARAVRVRANSGGAALGAVGTLVQAGPRAANCSVVPAAGCGRRRVGLRTGRVSRDLPRPAAAANRTADLRPARRPCRTVARGPR